MDEEEEKEYVALLADHQSMVRGFVISLMPGVPGADDVIQETNQVLWAKRGEFELGTNFKAWALRIARFQVMAHMKTMRRQRWVTLDDTTAELMATELETRLEPEREEQRLLALKSCLGKLGEAERDMLLRRYWKNQRLQDFCAITGLSLSNIKITLFRLRAGLKRCIQAEMKRQTS